MSEPVPNPAFRPPADGALTLITLGEVGLFRSGADGSRELLLGPGKPLAVVTYLRLNPGQTATRDTLIDLLWGDFEAERGRHALRQTFWQLRQILGEGSLVGKDEVRLVAPLATDRDDLVAAVERGDLERAVTLYQGHFLPGFAAPGGVGFEQWTDLERDRLRAIFLRCSETLIRRRLGSSEFREAQRLARRMRDLCPGSELSWRLVLESLATSRDFLSAAVEADALEAWAAAESLTLEPATRAAIRLARQVDAAEPPAAAGFVAELIGREAEFSAIVRAWEGARRGPARLVRVEAAAGLGKTRLLTDAAARLAAGGARVVIVRANMGERQIPFAFASELARAVTALPGAIAVSPGSASSLVGLNPTLSSRLSAAPDPSTGAEGLRKRALAIGEAIAAAADETPFALFIDDLHWIDGESRQILEAVESRLDGAPVLIVTARRPRREPASPRPGAVDLHLGPLSAMQVEQFVRSLGELPAGESWTGRLLDGLVKAGEGSPLYILEMLRLANDQGVLSLAADRWECRDADLLDRLLRAGEGIRARIMRLTEAERWLLLLLATAGTHLDAVTLPTIAGAPADPERSLNQLEHLGLVAREGGTVAIAHDAIAEAVLDTATPDRRREADLSYGAALVSHGGSDGPTLLRAARHFAAAESPADLVRLFRRYVTWCRDNGDARTLDALATEFVGAGVPARSAALVASLPLGTRLGLRSRSPRLVAAAVLAAATLGAGAFLARSADLPDAELLAWRTSAAHTLQVGRVPVREFGWRRTAVVDPPANWQTIVDSALSTPSYLTSDSAGSLVFSQNTDNAHTTDLFQYRAGVLRRLTAEPRDDGGSELSPDGRFVVFLTARWSRVGADDYDVAILDLATDSIRQLTHGDDWDKGVMWSPDGTRIAFLRTRRADGRRQVCIVGIDGRRERCLPTAPDVIGLVGWLSSTQLAIEAAANDQHEIRSVSIDGTPTATIYRGPVLRARVSADGAWMAVYAGQPGDETPAWELFRVADPEAVRRVRLSARDGAVNFTWSNRFLHFPLLDTVVVTGVRIGVGESARMSLAGRDRRGVPVPIDDKVVTWSTPDTGIVAVDSMTGEVRGRRPGRATLVASVGGWRTGRGSVEIVPAVASRLLEESWDSVGPVWRPFGSPRPFLGAGPDGVRGLVNNGDGSYPSGVYSTRAFPAAEGLGVEVRFSTPVTRDQWQSLEVHFASRRQAVVEGWDHVTSVFQTIERFAAENCGFAVPAGEGGAQRQAGVALGILVDHQVPLDPVFIGGPWYTVRVQIFPDGRCGVALNGRPVWMSKGRLPVDIDYRFWILGQSVGTHMMAGPLEIWRGDRHDIDWAAYGTER